jgi:uncharacterized BrkB/YihY/UPF0761 family membrane protein
MPADADQPAGDAAEHLTRRQRLRAASDRARGIIEEKRETSATVSLAFDAFGHDTEAGGPVLAAALGFRVFLFIVPYVGFFLIVLGFIGDAFDRSPEEMFQTRGIAALTAKGISTGHDLSTWTRITAFVLVTYALFLSARSFVKVLRIVHMLVWRTRPTRLLHTTRATLVFIATVTVSLGISGVIDVLTNRVVVGGVVALVLYILVPFGLWWGVSWWLPHGECDILGLVPGAVVFAVGVEILHVFTVVWFPHSLESKSEIYGAIGIALALLFWAYLLGRLMTFAAALNVALWRRRESDPSEPPDFLVRTPVIGDLIRTIWTTLAPRHAVAPAREDDPVDPPPAAQPPPVDPA